MTMDKRIELKDSGVLFNAEDHTYFLGEKELSGITGVIQRQLYPDEFDGIPEAVLQEAAEYGNSVHRSCEDFDRNWTNDGTVEVADYIQICRDHYLTHEASEYLVTDGSDYASQIDKVYRVDDTTFDLGDIKTYGVMSADKLEKARWQLSIYAYLFELQNKGAKVGRLFVLHIRNRQKQDGTFDHIADIIFVDRIPSQLCKELLATDLRGEKFENPYGIPDEIRRQESIIRELIQTKATIEEALNEIKARILRDMEAKNVRTWETPTMKLTRKLPTTRCTFNLNLFKAKHPEFNTDDYMKTTEIGSSLLISV